MKKHEATKVMLDHSRDVVFEDLAEDVAKAFGYTLHNLRIAPRPAESFSRLIPIPGHEKDFCVSMHELARKIAETETKAKIYSNMNGAGSFAQDITEKSIAMLCDCSPLIPNSHANDCPAVVLIKEEAAS